LLSTVLVAASAPPRLSPNATPTGDTTTARSTRGHWGGVPHLADHARPFTGKMNCPVPKTMNGRQIEAVREGPTSLRKRRTWLR
jgi:hypothetical protein